MMQCPAARIGDTVEQIDTPALIVDLDALEANIRKMSAFAAASGLRLRPHAKTHKCAAIARMQMAAGAVGICCQKVSEAEALARAGVTDILVSNEVVGRQKLDRLAALSKWIRVAVCADHPAQVDEIDAAAARFDTTIRVLVEVDIGGGRCGTQPGKDAVTLAKRIAAAPNLAFAGLQAYHGPAQHRRSHSERTGLIADAGRLLRDTVDMLAATGLQCDIIGGAGTGTFAQEAASGVWNELQVGSYVFMDRDYALNLDETGAPVSAFRHSLTIKTTVLSVPASGKIITDAGLKAYSTDSGLPSLLDFPAGKVVKAADEHTTIEIAQGEPTPELGSALRLIPGHCDPTVNLHDWIIGVRGNRVACIWPVDARGALL
jgi:D-serine deaminase-like pyridoxal phosphate-dependent protein